MSSVATRERILDAAERLFAERGVGGTSLRAVTSAAGVNLAAVHYHMGSKEALLREVLSRTIAPINQERLKRLDALEAGAAPVPLDALLEAFLRPALESARGGEDHPRLVSRLLARIYSDDSVTFQTVVLEQFAEVIERFSLALTASVPALDPSEALHRLQYCVAVLMHVLAGTPDVSRFVPFEHFPSSRETELQRMISFLSAGIRAPAISTDPRGAS